MSRLLDLPPLTWLQRIGRFIDHHPTSSFAISTLLGALMVATNLYITSTREAPLADRVAILSKSLAEATAVISQIEAEIDSRMDLVSELEQKTRTAQRLHDINREQVEAIAVVL